MDGGNGVDPFVGNRLVDLLRCFLVNRWLGVLVGKFLSPKILVIWQKAFMVLRMNGRMTIQEDKDG